MYEWPIAIEGHINLPTPSAGFEAGWPRLNNPPPVGASTEASFFSSAFGTPNRLPKGAADAAVGAAAEMTSELAKN
jgi:hypothetical protein